jgi:hypothetical protein
MVWAIANKSHPPIASIIDNIIASGQMNRQEHLRLSSAILSDHRLSEDDRRQINRVFDYLQIGRLKLVD